MANLIFVQGNLFISLPSERRGSIFLKTNSVARRASLTLDKMNNSASRQHLVDYKVSANVVGTTINCGKRAIAIDVDDIQLFSVPKRITNDEILKIRDAVNKNL